MLLILFAFLAGIVTILSPCILPVLPVILATSVTDTRSRMRPYGIVVGFVLSFTFFTLFLSTIVSRFGIPADTLRNVSVVLIALFGFSLIIPQFQLLVERMFARLANFVPSSAGKTGFGGGVVVGLSLGLLWTPCVGPILASVISLAIAGTVTGEAIFITLAYSLGTAIPMYIVILSGQTLLARIPWLLRNAGRIQRGFGVVMVLTALSLYLGLDRTFQSYVLLKFPQYGAGLTKFEDKAIVQPKIEDMKRSATLLQKRGTVAPELILGGTWFNTSPLTLQSLRGKVVLVDFWTYTCINCQRTLPYVKDWYEKYNDKGLVIIGVHAPEFAFEHDAANVARAIKDFGIRYPVMQDNNFATWKAFRNNYWPAKYLIDADGNIRYTHFGEGDYDKTELAIQELLRESGAQVDTAPSTVVSPSYGRTPETYLGSARSQRESYISLTGTWQQRPEYNAPKTGSTLKLQFNAKFVYLVMKNTGDPAQVKVYLDNVYVHDIVVDHDGLYTMAELQSPGSHTLRLEFVDDNAELFAFTFG